MQHTLEAYSGNKLIFFSDGKWLHPLFELETFLKKSPVDPQNLLLKDKIIGRAAALIIIYFGIKNIHAEILSEFGKDSLDKFGVKYDYDKLVERIICRTENLLKNEEDPEKAYWLIKKLALKSQKK